MTITLERSAERFEVIGSIPDGHWLVPLYVIEDRWLGDPEITRVLGGFLALDYSIRSLSWIYVRNDWQGRIAVNLARGYDWLLGRLARGFVRLGYRRRTGYALGGVWGWLTDRRPDAHLRYSLDEVAA